MHKKHEGKLYHTDCWRCQSCYGTMGKTPVAVQGQLYVAHVLLLCVLYRSVTDMANTKLLHSVCRQGLPRRVRALQQVVSRRLHGGGGQAVARRLPDMLQVQGGVPGRPVLREGRAAGVQRSRAVTSIHVCEGAITARALKNVFFVARAGVPVGAEVTRRLRATMAEHLSDANADAQDECALRFAVSCHRRGAPVMRSARATCAVRVGRSV